MGRQLKRVPLNFDAPLNKTWNGYINPHKSDKCSKCGGSGYNDATKKISDDWYSFDDCEWVFLPNGRRYNNKAWSNHITEVEIAALIEEERLWDFTRVPINDEQKQIVKEKIANGENSWLPFNNGHIPTPEEVNKWNTEGGCGHDAINRCICVEARAKHLGVYGLCEHCNGSGEIWDSEEEKIQYNEWEKIEPRKGDGYQMWENTSEGSPQTPVFKTLEELSEYCAEHCSTFADFKATKEEWYKMLDDGHIHHTEGNLVFI